VSKDFSQEIDFQVYPVAVDVNPVLWAVECELCDRLLNDGTSDEAEIGRLEFAHKAFHAGMSVAEYKFYRRTAREGK
jgi:hypothetical protein